MSVEKLPHPYTLIPFSAAQITHILSCRDAWGDTAADKNADLTV